jgi:hypothetical protein
VTWLRFSDSFGVVILPLSGRRGLSDTMGAWTAFADTCSEAVSVSERSGHRLREQGLRGSVRRVGSSVDSTMIESFSDDYAA